MESDPGYIANLFLSTPSARRATIIGNGQDGTLEVFLSTPSARRATTGRGFLNT